MLLDGEEVPLNTQEEIRKFVHEQLGLGIKRFTNLVYVRQGQLDRILEPSREDMDLILGITVIRELKEQLEQARRELEKYEGRDVATQVQQLQEETLPDLKARLERLKRDVSDLENEVEQLRDLIEKAESPELQSLLKLIGERDDNWHRLDQADQQAKALLERYEAENLDALASQIKKTKEGLEKLRKEAEAKGRIAENLNTEIRSHRAIAQRLKTEAERHQKLLEEGKKECPVCGQTVTAQTMKALIQGKTEESEKHEEKAGKLDDSYKEAKEEADESVKSSHQLENQISQMATDRKQVEGWIEKEEKHRQSLKENFDKIEERLNRLQLPFNGTDRDLKARVAERLPLDPKILQERKNRHKKLHTRLKEDKEEEKKLDKLLQQSENRLASLKKRKKRAATARKVADRLGLVTEERRRMVLRRLENQALRVYSQLTDQHLYQAIRIDKDTYRVYVHPTEARGEIPATRTGGGHQTLLSLALRLAILREGGHTSLLILDEPTYGVDRENLPQLMSHITEAAKQVSQVLLVTHQGFGEEEATNIINVELNEHGFSEITTI